MTRLTELAPAKINLSLHVGPPKTNGRHDLISLVTFAGPEAADTLVAEPSDHFSLAVSGPFAGDSGPARDNLVLKAARALNEALDHTLPPLAFRLHKALPCAAGIGGGSADAAAALRLMIRAHGGDEARSAAQAVAPALGGDVPACLNGLPGIMSGEGEDFEPLLGIPALPAVLANPGVPCPTGPVFRAYDEIAPGAIPQHDLPKAGRLNPSAFIDWLITSTDNSLQRTAMSRVQEIPETLAALQTLDGVLATRMSGSGATCFALFESYAAAETAASSLQTRQPGWWVASTLLGAN